MCAQTETAKRFMYKVINKIKNKKGVSGVLTTVILIAIVLVLVGIVWAVIKPMIEKNMAHASACSPSDIIGKINLNKLNTCYKEIDDPQNPNLKIKTLYVSVEIEDLKYDKILVKVYKGGNTKTQEIKNQAQNSGETHEYNVDTLGLDGKPDSIKLVPVINGEQCDVVDSISEIATCP